jgi:hypothetical protein
LRRKLELRLGLQLRQRSTPGRRLASAAGVGGWRGNGQLHSAEVEDLRPRRRKQYCARLSRVADALLCFCSRSKCLAQGFFLGVVKRCTQHLPANALKLLENLVWGNFADQEK